MYQGPEPWIAERSKWLGRPACGWAFFKVENHGLVNECCLCSIGLASAVHCEEAVDRYSGKMWEKYGGCCEAIHDSRPHFRLANTSMSTQTEVYACTRGAVVSCDHSEQALPHELTGQRSHRD